MKFDHLTVIGDYVHLRLRKGQARITIPVSEITFDSPASNIELSSDGRSIRWSDLDGEVHSRAIITLLGNEHDELKLSPITMLRMDEIQGIHPLITKYLEEAGAKDASSKSPAGITENALLKYLWIHPIIVHRYRGNLYCLGNITAYKIAASFLDPNLLIPVQIHTARKVSSSTQNLVINELLTTPIFHYSAPPPDNLYRRWVLLTQKGFESPYKFVRKSKRAFAKWLGVGAQKLK